MYKILAIETSCDETACAIVEAQHNKVSVLANVVSSQIKLHQKTQGIVPEIAARAHIQKISTVTAKALADSGLDTSDIDYFAATTGPGLVTSLMVGAEYVKGLSMATGKPLVKVNHMLGHLYSAFLAAPKIPLPAINLIVSGGHTYLVLLKDKNNYRIVGQTVDDAAGEAFDKVARMLGLPYPGGPQISKYALRGKQDYKLPRPMLHASNSNKYNFSFAGLKTSVLYLLRGMQPGQKERITEPLDANDPQIKADIAFSFENAVVDVLLAKTINAAQKFGAKSITLSGGVAANKKLRSDLQKATHKIGLELYVPEFSLCTDNALIIANAAAIQIEAAKQKGVYTPNIKNLNLIKADPTWEI